MSIEYTYNNITTNEDMMRLKGIDLNEELVSTQTNDSNAKTAEQAINDVEEWLINYVNLNYSFKGGREDLSPYQKERFKKAVCEQIDYILDNGDLRNISGINQDNNTIIDIAILEKRGIAPSALMNLRMCGLANLMRY